MRIPKKGVGHCKQRFIRILTGKKLLVSDDKMLYCPRCKSKMDKLIKDKIEIDVCSYCNGMWLDDGEINKLTRYVKSNEISVPPKRLKNGKEKK